VPKGKGPGNRKTQAFRPRPLAEPKLLISTTRDRHPRFSRVPRLIVLCRSLFSFDDFFVIDTGSFFLCSLSVVFGFFAPLDAVLSNSREWRVVTTVPLYKCFSYSGTLNVVLNDLSILCSFAATPFPIVARPDAFLKCTGRVCWTAPPSANTC